MSVSITRIHLAINFTTFRHMYLFLDNRNHKLAIIAISTGIYTSCFIAE